MFTGCGSAVYAATGVGLLWCAGSTIARKIAVLIIAFISTLIAGAAVARISSNKNLTNDDSVSFFTAISCWIAVLQKLRQKIISRGKTTSIIERCGNVAWELYCVALLLI